ncbi:hypothetical protein ACFWAT_08115 [Streptomyces syringium]|uniref:hypothetical protein n=1 Tax=Streptomyces syringium TaxID=76729 RepID=UPI0036667D94
MRDLFEEQSDAMKTNCPERIARSMSAVNALGLRLQPPEGGEEVILRMIHIVDGKAKFRA